MNTRITAESETHIAIFEVAARDLDGFDTREELRKRSTFWMPVEAGGSTDAVRAKQRELIEQFGFGIYYDYNQTDEEGGGERFYFSTNPGNSRAILMSLAKKESA